MTRHMKPALSLFAAVALAGGAAHAQDQTQNGSQDHAAWVANENAATAAAQQSQEAQRMQAAAETCGKIAAYWQEHKKPFDMDTCLNDPGAAQQAVTADKNAVAQAEYQRQQELHNQQESAYAQQQAEYQRELAEYQRQRQMSQPSGSSPAVPPQ